MVHVLSFEALLPRKEVLARAKKFALQCHPNFRLLPSQMSAILTVSLAQHCQLFFILELIGYFRRAQIVLPKCNIKT